MARLFGALLLSAGLLSAQPPARLPFQDVDVRLDGKLEEWGGALAVNLDRREQIWMPARDPSWGGRKDLSATIWLSYDDAHLYVAGRIRDDSLVRERSGRTWNRGDGIELFLDLDPDDESVDEAGRPSYAFDEDEVQLFLMPLNPRRSWGAMMFPMASQGGGRQAGGAFTGVRVAHVETPSGYDFEAVVPFHNFAALRPGPREIGCNVALNDFDAGSDRYRYMTWTGTNPLDPPEGDSRRLRRLVFGGPVLPLQAGTGASGAFYDDLVGLASFVALPLAIVLGLALALWGWSAVSRRRPRLRVAGRVLGVVLLAAGLFVPGQAIGLRERGMRAAVDDVVSVLQREVPRMERGTLASYGGGQRDRPLMDLLSGRALARKQSITYAFLRDMARGGFGEGPFAYPNEGFPVLPYWIPLPIERTEQVNFRRALAKGFLDVVFSAPFDRDLDETPRLRLLLRGPKESGAVVEKELVLDGPWELGGFANRPQREVTFRQVRLDGPVESISVTALEGEGLELVGLTWLSEQGGPGQPLYLGQPSLGGVRETDLRGRYPESAGVLLGSGELRRVDLRADRARGYEKLWLFYHARHPGADQIAPAMGSTVAEVLLSFAGGRPAPVRIELQHQVSMFFELAGHNQESEPPDPRASVAFKWEDVDQEQHISLVYEVDLPPDAVVERIEFRNKGPYPVRFRSVVFGASKPTVAVEPEDSPLELSSPLEVRLKREVLERVSGASFAIYRNGSLTATTLPEPAARERQNLPRRLQRELSPEAVQTRVAEDGDGRIYEAYLPLTGGWGHAVLGVFVADARHGAFARLAHRVGLLLCLLSAPLLLILFGELLAFLKNLRLRLVAVLSVATMAPLAVMSLVLLRVLESGHEADLRGGLRQDMAAALGRLRDQQSRLLESAKAWLDTLVGDVGAVAVRARGTEGAERLAALRRRLQATMQSQLPPEWQGGFLRLNFTPGEGFGLDPFSEFVGDPKLQGADAGLRKEPGVYLAWGVPFLGVRWDRALPDVGICSLSVARPIDRGLLGGFSPGRGVLLCDSRGYPLAAVGGAHVAAEDLERSGRSSRLMAERRAALAEVLEQQQTVVRRHRAAGQAWIAAYEVLRDPEETPRAILGLVDVDPPAILPLSVGRVPVRQFFVVGGVLLLVLSVFLSFVVTTRITKPIERLEHGAQALGRGELDVRVESEEGGQIGRLTRAFNRMAQELRSRIQDLHDLNRGILELTSSLDLQETLSRTVAFCVRHSPAEGVRILLRAREPDRVELFGEQSVRIDSRAPEIVELMQAAGPLALRLTADRGPAAQELSRLFPQFRSALALPLVLAGRNQGAILLLFASPVPATVNLELLSTLAAQAAAALENARLYRHAVEDLSTGAYVPDYFRRRVVQEVARAQARGERLSLLGLALADGPRLVETLGPERFERLMERVAASIRELLPDEALLCRAGVAELQVMLAGVEREAAAEVRDRLVERLQAAQLELPFGAGRLALRSGAATFPEQAASAEFLFHALGSSMSEPRSVARPIHEEVELLQEEGVVMQSPTMQRVLRTLQRVAATDLTVLLEGETGTGKEVLANLIHRWSKRSRGPLVKVHCAALSESLLQSELFGHEKGAFTGAVARKIGKFEQAQGGTIFLDEIGEISLDVQIKLLRVLQEHEIDRVGGLEPVKVDVRVVAATNRNIRDMVAQGTFREDLYYRLQGMVVTVPPLRERKEEIPHLVELFRQEAVEAGHTRVRGFSAEAMDELFRRDWPGNVRELRNTVFRAMVLATGPLVMRADLAGVGLAPREAGAAARADQASPVGGTAEADAPVTPVLTPRPRSGAQERGAQAPAKPGVSLTPRQRRLYELIQRRGTISTQEYCQEAGVSPRTGLRDLTDLVAKGLVVRVGKRRGARYRLRDRGEIVETSGEKAGG